MAHEEETVTEPKEPAETAPETFDPEGETIALEQVPVGSSAWAIMALASGQRVMREAWVNNKHFDPRHIRGGIQLSFEDIIADDWKVI